MPDERSDRVPIGEKSINTATLDRAERTFRLIDDHGDTVEPFFKVVDRAPDQFVIVTYVFGDCIAWELCYTALVSLEEAETLIPAYSGIAREQLRHFGAEYVGISSGGFHAYRLRAWQDLRKH